MLRRLAAGAFAIASLAGGPSAQPAPERLGELLLCNYMFILFHELGHALIHELSLPVVGVEEDVVDEFAAIALIGLAGSDEMTEAQRTAMHRLVVDAALGFAALWEMKVAGVGGDATRLPYWDEHGLDIKRFYNVLCIFAGSDTRRFGDIARQAGMPDERIARCERDFARKDAAWERILTPHLRGDAPLPQQQRVVVGYGRASTPAAQALERDLRARGLLESVAEMLELTFVLPRGLRLSAGECGEPNAFYAPDEGRVVLCHELVEFLRAVFLQPQGAPGPQPVPQTQPRPGPQPGPWPGPQTGPQPQATPYPAPQPGQMPQPYPVPAPQQASLEAYLVGNWQGAYADPASGAPIQVQLSIMPGRAFSQLSYNGWTGFMMRIWGTFVVMGDALRTQVEGYEPRRYCGPTGECIDLVIPMAETVPIRVFDMNTMSAGPAWLQRAP